MRAGKLTASAALQLGSLPAAEQVEALEAALLVTDLKAIAAIGVASVPTTAPTLTPRITARSLAKANGKPVPPKRRELKRVLRLDDDAGAVRLHDETRAVLWWALTGELPPAEEYSKLYNIITAALREQAEKEKT